MRWQNCIFDLYGTLVDIHTDETSPRLWVCMAEFYRRHGALYHPSELRTAYFRLMHELEGGPSLGQEAHEAHPEIQIERVFWRLYQEKGIDATHELALRAGRAFRQWSTDYLRLYPGAAELLAMLRSWGCGVWLLSNAQGVFTRQELNQLGIDQLFDGVYLSSDYGVKKPDRRFFDILLREQGIQPERAVMIDNDGVCDIQGEKAAGLDTFYIRSNLSPEEPTPGANYILEQMDLRRVGEILIT